MTKECGACHVVKDVSEFFKRPDRVNAIRWNCKACAKKDRLAYGRKNPEKNRAYTKRHPGTKFRRFWPDCSGNECLQKYNALLEAQNFVCAICKNPSAFRKLAVDHDHKTGRVRGLLCTRCNLALGYLQDSAQNCENAANYLKK